MSESVILNENRSIYIAAAGINHLNWHNVSCEYSTYTLLPGEAKQIKLIETESEDVFAVEICFTSKNSNVFPYYKTYLFVLHNDTLGMRSSSAASARTGVNVEFMFIGNAVYMDILNTGSVECDVRTPNKYCFWSYTI